MALKSMTQFRPLMARRSEYQARRFFDPSVNRIFGPGTTPTISLWQVEPLPSASHQGFTHAATTALRP